MFSMSARESIRAFKQKHPTLYDFLADLAFALAIVVAIGGLLYAYAGTWPPIVSVIGNSMYPHMHDNDLVFLQGLDRGAVITHGAAEATGYTTYADFGDVIVYRPMGDPGVKPVIHRAMYWVNQSEPMWYGGPPAPASGYITAGDNNGGVIDQDSSICYRQPVRPEWIVGIARLNVPYVGYIRKLMPF